MVLDLQVVQRDDTVLHEEDRLVRRHTLRPDRAAQYRLRCSGGGAASTSHCDVRVVRRLLDVHEQRVPVEVQRRGREGLRVGHRAVLLLGVGARDADDVHALALVEDDRTGELVASGQHHDDAVVGDDVHGGLQAGVVHGEGRDALWGGKRRVEYR